MTTMGKAIDRVLEEVKPKASQIGDLAMHAALKSGLPTEDLQRVIERGGEFQDAILPILRRLGAAVSLVDSKLLQPVTLVLVCAVEVFAARAHFQRGTVEGVVIGYISSDFKSAFLRGEGKIETNVSMTNLRVHRFRQSSGDASIIAELGGEAQAETTLANIWELLKRQGHGQEGDLLTNGYANIFYVRDAQKKLMSVNCRWDSGYRHWYVYAAPLTHPYVWYQGCQVLSR